MSPLGGGSLFSSPPPPHSCPLCPSSCFLLFPWHFQLSKGSPSKCVCLVSVSLPWDVSSMRAVSGLGHHGCGSQVGTPFMLGSKRVTAEGLWVLRQEILGWEGLHHFLFEDLSVWQWGLEDPRISSCSFLNFLAALCGLWDLNTLTRDRTCVPCSGSVES